MPAKNPRVSAVVEPGLIAWLRARARRQRSSVSLVVRDILHSVREEDEERFWAAAGEERLADFKPDESLSGDEVWR